MLIKHLWPENMEMTVDNRQIKCQSEVSALRAEISTGVRVKMVVAWFGDCRRAQDTLALHMQTNVFPLVS